MNVALSTIFIVIFTCLAIFYGVGTTYEVGTTTSIARYSLVQDVHVMIFVGFGFLMSFLHKSGMTATGHAFLVAVFAMLWGILMRGFFGPLIDGGNIPGLIHIDLYTILNGDFCAAACLISMGAVIGRVTAAQLLVMTTIECALYAINETLLVHTLRIADIGGALFIHAFGALFGLACSWVLGKAADHKEKDRSNNKANRQSDTMAMVGTLFLFCFWPSFTSAVAGLTDAATQQRAFVNTFIAMGGSVLSAFATMQFVYGGKFRMVEVQNSTLAAGVAFGILADMALYPFGSLLVGGGAGFISVLGYAYLQAWLEEKLDLLDTCGVCNLHFLPAIFGAVVACVITAKADQEKYNGKIGEVFVAMTNYTDSHGRYREARTNSEQAAYQLAAIGVTLAIALAGGLLVGFLISFFEPITVMYDDVVEYVIEHEEEEEGKGGDDHGKKSNNIPQLSLPKTAPDDSDNVSATLSSRSADSVVTHNQASSEKRQVFTHTDETPEKSFEAMEVEE